MFFIQFELLRFVANWNTMENKGEMLIYESTDNNLEIQVRLENETIWLSQRLMAELFEKDTDTIGLHIKNIFTEGELEEKPTTEFFSVVQAEGKGQKPSAC